jgi:endonuclease/exonuclease/phosphatase family metal-dependent hydrolase
MMEEMRPSRLAAAAMLVAVALAPGSCAPARNYTDPSGPWYATRYGRPAGGTADVGPSAFAATDAVRVVTFNIAHAARIDRAIEVLSGTPALARPDLLLLQEMDAPGTERIARALGMNSVYSPSAVHPHDGKDFGNALLSPWPIEGPRRLLLPHESRGIRLRRAATEATVLLRGRRLRVYSVHFETMLRLGGAARREQVQALLEDAKRSGDPVVIAGDLNSRGLAPLIEAGGFAWLTRDVHDTAGFFDFDHVFARGLSPAARPAAGVEASRGASDHRPVWALLRFD